MDVRVANGVERFVNGEIELFGRPRKNLGPGVESAPLVKDDSYSFCAFCVYLAVNSFNISVNGYGDAVTEGYSERGFDGIAISLNDIPLDSPETAEVVARNALSDYKEKILEEDPRELPVLRVLMVQVKMAASAKTNDLDSLGSSAYRFLSRENYLSEMTPNAMVARWWKIYDAIRRVYAEAGVTFAPELDLLFIYQGYKSEEEALNNTACLSQRDILCENLKHDKVNFSIWRIDEIIDAIALADQAVDGVLKGARLLELPKGNAFGYIGYVPAASISDLIPKIKILGDKKDRPDERVFADNVRSFTGDHKNPGAVALRQTLTEGEADQVILRHNGITIVARDANLKGVPGNGGVDVELKAYQIVNGAQSSFVLQRNDSLLEGAYVPIKIVVTESDQVKDGVVLGANLQSQVSQYDMLARKPEIRAIQQGFKAIRQRTLGQALVSTSQRRAFSEPGASSFSNPDSPTTVGGFCCLDRGTSPWRSCQCHQVSQPCPRQSFLQGSSSQCLSGDGLDGGDRKALGKFRWIWLGC